ncbi:unnamed protein product, partial [marine sediment metagenome]
LFKNKEGRNFILMANRDWKATQTAILTLNRNAVSTVAALDRKTGKWAELQLTQRGDRMTVAYELGPGDGTLLRIVRPPSRAKTRTNAKP